MTRNLYCSIAPLTFARYAILYGPCKAQDPRLQRLDANDGGRLRPAEVGAPRIFSAAETDGGGFISPAVYESANRNRENLPAGRPVPRGAGLTETSHALTVDGRERAYVLHAPNLPRGPLPVVFFFHGGGHTMPGRRLMRAARLEALVGKTNRDFDAREVIWQFFASCPPRETGEVASPALIDQNHPRKERMK